MALHTNGEKLTELFGYEGEGIVRLSDKIIYLGELKAWRRTATATHNFLDSEIVYTKVEKNVVGKFIYNNKGELYIVSDGDNEYCYYVKSFDEQSNGITISYDTYDNIKSGNLSNELPLGPETIAYERYADLDKTM